MSNEQYSAKISLDGSQVEAELLKLARDTGTLNQALAQAVTNGLKPLAAAMDQAAVKAKLLTTQIKGGGALNTRQLNKNMVGALTPNQQARRSALALFDAYKKLAESGVRPTSRALLTLASAFEHANVPIGMSRKLFQDAAVQLRAMESGANRAGRAITVLEQQEKAKAAAARRRAKDEADALAAVEANRAKVRTTFQKKERGEEGSIFNSNEAERRRDNASSLDIQRAVIRDEQRRQASRGRLGTSVQTLQTRTVGSPFANVYKGSIDSAKRLADYGDATRAQYDAARQVILDIGRKLAFAGAKSREEASAAATTARERRGELAAAQRIESARQRATRLLMHASKQQEIDLYHAKKREQLEAKTNKALAGQAQHGLQTEKALLRMSSAAQGAMLGQALLNRQVTGVGFSLIFARWAIIKWMAAAAAATIIAGGATGLAKAFVGLAKAGSAVATAFEASGQKIANYFQNSDIAQKINSQASKLAKSYDIPTESAKELLTTLESIGLNQDVYKMADLNASAAGVGNPGELAQRIKDITKADADVRGEMTRQLSKDYNIPVKKYANSLEIATAINKRFAGSAVNMGNTLEGQLNKVSTGWYEFKVAVGAVVNQFLGPLLQPIIGFIKGITDGFAAARDSAKATGEFDKNLQSFSQTMRKITPFMIHFGFILGKVIYKAIITTVKIIKVLADTFIRLWNRLKPVREAIQIMVHWVKQLLDKLLSWYLENKKLVDIMAALGFIIFGLPRLLAAFIMGIDAAIGGLINLGKAILGIPKAIVNFAISGFEAVMNAIKSLLTTLGLIGDKHVKVDSDITGGKELDEYGRKINAIPSTKHTKITNDLPPEAGGTKAPGTGTGIGLPSGESAGRGIYDGILKFLVGNAGGIFTGLAIILTRLAPLIFNPVGATIAAAIIAGIVIGLAVAYPKETGNIAGTISGGFLNAIVQVPGLLTLGLVNMARVILSIIESSFSTTFAIIGAIIGPIFGVITDTVQNVVSDVGNILSGLFSGNWMQAVRGAAALLKDLTVQPIIDMGKAMFWAFDNIITNIIPTKFKELWDKIKGPLGIDFLSTNIIGPIADWGAKFAGGFNETFDNNIVPSFTKNFGKAWDSINQGFGESDTVYGLKNALKTGFAGLQWIGDNIGNPFSRMGTFIQRMWEYMTRFLRWIADNAANLNPANWVKGIAGAFGGFEWPNFDMGGVVPGRAGTKVPVMATAGEVFLGAPSVAASSGRLNGLGGGGGTNIFISVSDSVVTNADAMSDLTDKIAGTIVQRLGFSRNLTFHRV